VAITAIRTVIIYIVLIIAMRIMGRRQLGELQPIELVVTLLISDMASVPMGESGIPLMSGLIPIFVLVAAEILFSAWMLKSPRFASLVSGTPMVVVRDGKPDPDALSTLRLSVDDLSESLRSQGYFDFRDVQLAIAETGGSVTVYPTAASRPVVRGDLSLPPSPDHGMPLVVLADGCFCDWALDACGVSRQDVSLILEQESVQAEDVLVLTLNATGRYYLVRKEMSA